MQTLATTSTEFIFILFAEAVTDREEVPASLLIHIPHICFLTCILCIWFVDQMHQEKPETDNLIIKKLFPSVKHENFVLLKQVQPDIKMI